jgi:hypothetical protein
VPGAIRGGGFAGQGFPGGAGTGGPGALGMPGMTGTPGMMGMPGMGGTPGMMGMPGMGGTPGMMGMPGMGGTPGMMGMPGMGGYGRSLSATTELVQYKLVRFFDMDVEPERVYRYRIRLFVEDPNNPNTDPDQGVVSNPPRRRTLAPEVIDRLNRQQSDDRLKNAFYVMTDWSEPTEPVSLPSTSRAYVGEVDRPRMAFGAQGSLVQQSEIRGSIVPVVWHEKYAVDVAAETRAYRGSVLNLKQQFEVLDPVSLTVKLLKDFDFQNNFLVVDIRGGEDLPGDRKHAVTAAGEYILLDDRGNFVVRNELDDYEDFRRFTLEGEQSTGGTGFPGMGGLGTGGTMPGSGMTPGMMPGTMPGTGMTPGMMPGMMPGGTPGAGGTQPGKGRGTRRGG